MFANSTSAAASTHRSYVAYATSEPDEDAPRAPSPARSNTRATHTSGSGSSAAPRSSAASAFESRPRQSYAQAYGGGVALFALSSATTAAAAATMAPLGPFAAVGCLVALGFFIQAAEEAANHGRPRLGVAAACGGAVMLGLMLTAVLPASPALVVAAAAASLANHLFWAHLAFALPPERAEQIANAGAWTSLGLTCLSLGMMAVPGATPLSRGARLGALWACTSTLVVDDTLSGDDLAAPGSDLFAIAQLTAGTKIFQAVLPRLL